MNSPAVARGIAMMSTPMRELPEEALVFMGFMCDRYGGCGETMLTSYCVYAQTIEGLECDDDLYSAKHELVQKDWNEAMLTSELVRADDGTPLRVRRKP